MKNFYKNSKEDELINFLKSIEVTAPNGLWNDIQATLIAKRKRKYLIITSWASAASIALLFTIGGVYMMSSKVDTIASNENKSRIDVAPIISSEKSKSQIVNTGTVRYIKPVVQTNEHQQETNINSSVKPSSVESIEIKSDEVILSELKSIYPSTVKLEYSDIEINRVRELAQSNYIGNVIALAEPAEKKPKGEWFLSASGFPVYAFHTSGAINRTGTRQEEGIVSWGGSFSVRYAFTKRFSLETGLTYNILGQQEKNIFLVSSDESNSEVRDNSVFSNSYGFFTVPYPELKVMTSESVYQLSTAAINASSFNKVDALQQFKYLEIPIILAKGFSVKGVNLSLKAGLSAGILIGNRLDLNGSDFHLKGRTNGVDPFITSALASIGISVPIANRVNLLVEPSFKIGLKSLSASSPTTYPFSTYIKFGIEVPI